MNTIWIICGTLLIGTAISNCTITSTNPTTNTSDLSRTSLTTESTFEPRHSPYSFDNYNLTPTTRLTVSSTNSFSPRISTVDSGNTSPYKYLDTSYTNNFPIYHTDHPKLSTSNPFHTSGAPNINPTVPIRHLVALGTIESGKLHSIYPNKFYNGKFSSLNTRPLSSNIESSLTRGSINYSPTYLDTKSIKHNPTFTSASLTNTGNLVPINLEQLQTSRETPELIRTTDIEPKPNYPVTFNKPKTYLPSTEKFQTVPNHLPAAPYSFSIPSVGAAENYQLFSAQPQLHFNTNSQQLTHQLLPFERIRTDVEVINKKRPSISPPKDDDSGYDESDEGENFRKKHNPSRATNTQQATNYQLPNSPIFNSYDAAFGKYSKLSPDIPKKEKLIEKPERYVPNSDNVSEKQVYELQLDDASSDSRENFEYDVESESAPRERLQRDYNDGARYNDESIHFDSYGKDFNDEFEKSYSRKHPIEEFSHIKEVPDVDESVNKEKIITREEKKHASKHTSVIAPPREEYGYKIPRQNRTRSESTGNPSEILSNNERYKLEKNIKTPKQSSLKTKISFNAPINEIKTLRYHEQNPYIYQGGIKIINPPVLSTLSPI